MTKPSERKFVVRLEQGWRDQKTGKMFQIRHVTCPWIVEDFITYISHIYYVILIARRALDALEDVSKEDMERLYKQAHGLLQEGVDIHKNISPSESRVQLYEALEKLSAETIRLDDVFETTDSLKELSREVALASRTE